MIHRDLSPDGLSPFFHFFLNRLARDRKHTQRNGVREQLVRSPIKVRILTYKVVQKGY